MVELIGCIIFYRAHSGIGLSCPAIYGRIYTQIDSPAPEVPEERQRQVSVVTTLRLSGRHGQDYTASYRRCRLMR